MQTAWFFSDWKTENWIAAYAALVASGTFGWQLFLWRQQRGTNVTVQVLDSLEPRLGEPHRILDYVVTVHVTNSGHVTQYVENIGVRTADGRKILDVKDYGSEDLQPNETIPHRAVLQEDLREIEQFVGFVQLGNREEVKSRPQGIRADVLKEWTASNILTW
jgi:hypothetical protein